MRNELIKQLQMLSRQRQAVGVALLLLVGAAVYGLVHISGPKHGHSEISSQSRKGLTRYSPTPAEWATPVFSPYAGRVTRLLARPGDSVVKGQSLFVIEAADNVQAQNDFITAMTAMNKAKSALALAEIQDKRARDLFEG